MAHTPRTVPSGAPQNTLRGFTARCTQSRCGSALIFRDDFDYPDDIAVELRQVLCRNPVLLMNRGADGFDSIPPQKLRADLKAGHEASPRPAFGVPIARDLRGVLFVENRIEDRLMWQSRREFVIAAGHDQIQLFLPDRAIEGRRLVHRLFDFILVFLFRRHITVYLRFTSMPRASICAENNLSARSLSFPDQKVGPSVLRRLFSPIKTRVPSFQSVSTSVTSSHPIRRLLNVVT